MMENTDSMKKRPIFYSRKIKIFIYSHGDALELIHNLKVIPHADKVRMSLNTCKTITDNKSTMTFDSMMEFIGANEYALAA